MRKEMTAGEKILHLQCITRCSLKDLGEVLGMYNSQLCWYTKGKFNPHKKNKAKIDKLYDIMFNHTYMDTWGDIIKNGGIMPYMKKKMKKYRRKGTHEKKTTD